MENAAIVYSSWQRPAMLIDPYDEGTNHLKWLSRLINNRKLVSLDMDTRYFLILSDQTKNIILCEM